MPKGRVESFNDCVIAFAITLLILDIHPEDVGTKTNSAGMIHAIIALAPHFSIYVISFLICTVAWISHHEFMHDLEYVDRSRAPLAEQSVPDVDCIPALPNRTAWKSSGPTCGGRRLRVRLLRYMPFLLRYALVRRLPRSPNEKRNERHEGAPRPVALAVLCYSLQLGSRRRVVRPVPRFVLIRCYSGVLHHQQTCEFQTHCRRPRIAHAWRQKYRLSELA